MFFSFGAKVLTSYSRCLTRNTHSTHKVSDSNLQKFITTIYQQDKGGTSVAPFQEFSPLLTTTPFNKKPSNMDQKFIEPIMRLQSSPLFNHYYSFCEEQQFARTKSEALDYIFSLFLSKNKKGTVLEHVLLGECTNRRSGISGLHSFFRYLHLLQLDQVKILNYNLFCNPDVLKFKAVKSGVDVRKAKNTVLLLGVSPLFEILLFSSVNSLITKRFLNKVTNVVITPFRINDYNTGVKSVFLGKELRTCYIL